MTPAEFEAKVSQVMEKAGFDEQEARVVAGRILDRAMASETREITESEIREIVIESANEFELMITDVMEATIADAAPEIIEWALLLILA